MALGTPAQLTLRSYQRQAIDDLLRKNDYGKGAVLLVMPCGAGKTETAIGLAYAMDRRTLVVAHRRELVFQTYDRFRRRGIVSNDITMLMSTESYNPDAKFCIASIQTLQRRKLLPESGLLIVDEAHLSLANGYKKLIEACKERGTFVVGLTATPYRTQRDAYFNELYDDYLVAIQPKDLIAGGYILKPNYYITDSLVNVDELDVSGVGDNKDYDAKSYTRKWLEINGPASFFKAIAKYADGLKTIVFNPSIELAEYVHGLLLDSGLSAGLIHSKMTRAAIAEQVSQFRNGHLQYLVNVSILCEGFDLPSCECVILNLATMSKSKFIQMVGRVQRPGKSADRCVVIDTANNIERLGEPWAHIYPQFEPVPVMEIPRASVNQKEEEATKEQVNRFEFPVDVKDVNFLKYISFNLEPWQTTLEEGGFFRPRDVMRSYPVCGEAARVISERFGPIVVFNGMPMPAYPENAIPDMTISREDRRKRGRKIFIDIIKQFGANNDDINVAYKKKHADYNSKFSK